MLALRKNGRSVALKSIDKPMLLSEKDVLIRVVVCGVCRTDIYVAEGLIPCKNPLTLGHEFSGWIEKIGHKVEGLKIGDRVGVMPWFRNSVKSSPDVSDYSQHQMMGVDYDGAFSEYVIVPAHTVYVLPVELSFRQGAYLEPITAAMAVLNTSIKPHQQGLIFGQNRIAQLLKRVLSAHGFHDVSLCGSEEDLPQNHFDYVIETIATTESLKKIIQTLKPKGTLILKSRSYRPVTLLINALVMKDIRIESASYHQFSAAIELLQSGKLIVDDLLGDVFKLHQFEDVFKQSQHPQTNKLFFSEAEYDVWSR